MAALQNDPRTEALLDSAARGDAAAVRQLLDQHRQRLRRMVAVRLDRRLAARLDASDVVQETLADAASKLEGYLRDRPMPFYPWLHRLAGERVTKAHRKHLAAGIREVGCENPNMFPLTDDSAAQLVDRLVDSATSASGRIVREEQHQRVREAMGRLAHADREVLVMRYLEQLAFGEIGAILGITEAAAKMRHLRALEKIRSALGYDKEDEDRSR